MTPLNTGIRLGFRSIAKAIQLGWIKANIRESVEHGGIQPGSVNLRYEICDDAEIRNPGY